MKKIKITKNQVKTVISLIISIVLVSAIALVVVHLANNAIEENEAFEKELKLQQARSYAVTVTAKTNHINNVIFEDEAGNLFVYNSPDINLNSKYVLVLDDKDTATQRDDVIISVVKEHPTTKTKK